MKDVLGTALSDHYHQTSTGKLWVHNTYGPKEEMPVDVYFRDMEAMPELEWIALQQCKGRVLDIGAGAGSHALALQQMGLEITALDISPKAAEIMALRGVKQIIRQDFFELTNGSFDTLLLLMNGIGLSGTLSGLRTFLEQARKLIRPGGQLIFDSSDIAYLYNGKVPAMQDYYGEILYQYQYKRQRSDWFKWLFIDRKTLTEIATSAGWHTQVLFEDKWDQFLVKCQTTAI
jgi:2-polyprenyl-3-methyl-5-hydroxy-6-metoxy-1,4-benzoquinol methylase